MRVFNSSEQIHIYKKNRLKSTVNKKEVYMKQKDNFRKDWMKVAKAFAKQAYGKKKMESIQQERRIMEAIKQVEWWGD